MFDREPVEKGDGDRRTNPVDVHVGGRIAHRRRSLGLSQSDLGQALGLTFQQIQKYERGANRVSASKLWEAAGFLGVPVRYLFEGLAQTDGAKAETKGAFRHEAHPDDRAPGRAPGSGAAAPDPGFVALSAADFFIADPGRGDALTS
ncbi:helix-turn-helix domain-containing protein [Brevundimonas aurantiaca]|uniref:helix-turn-helix domain-containing protein n=1 Tax=Brevundimonas aurantiaca TaxID=74316 RepID=UPI00174E7B68|nr:helix-turn-helix transcriptional regulator [Brevundimonas aurantiaca]